MLLCDGGDVIDRGIKKEHIPVRPKAHVINRFRVDTDPQATFGVAEMRHERLASSIRVSIVSTRVVDFGGVFGTRRPTVAHEVQPVRPCPHIFRKRQDECVACNGSSRLEFTNEVGPEIHLGLPILPTLFREKRIEVQVSINAAHDAVSIDQAIVKVKTLFTINGFDLDSFDGPQDDANAVHGIVNSKGSFFI